MAHPLEKLMDTVLANLKGMVDVSTVVGQPVQTQDGNVVVPVSRMTLGFVAGGSDWQESQPEQELPKKQGESEQQQLPFGAGSAGVVVVAPVGFLVVGREIRYLPVSGGSVYERLLEKAPEMLVLLDRVLARVCRGE
mgnify:CR=1 FL=1